MRGIIFTVCIFLLALFVISCDKGKSSPKNDEDALASGDTDILEDADLLNDGLLPNDSDQIGGPCEEGQTRLLPCGENKEKVQAQECKDGVWEDKGECVDDPNPCVEGETRFLACEGDGVQKQTCTNGTWGAPGPCVQGAGDCSEGDTRTVVCGTNQAYEQGQICESGLWVNDGACVDPGPCDNGDQKEVDCGVGNGTVQKFSCVDGIWEPVGGCVVPETPIGDEDNRLLRRIFKNGFGQVTGIEEFGYAPDTRLLAPLGGGILFRDTMYNKDGLITSLVEKDAFGNVITNIARDTDPNNTFMAWEEFEYDAAGEFLVKEVNRNESGTITFWKEYERYEKGNLKKETTKNYDGNVSGIKEYENIEPGHSLLLKETHWDQFGNMTSSLEREMIQGLPRVVTDFVRNNHLYEYVYNADGLLMTETRTTYYADGTESLIVEYTYDWAGYKKNGTELRRESLYLDYDENGELIKERRYNSALQQTKDYCKGSYSGECGYAPISFVDGGVCYCTNSYSSSCLYTYTNYYQKEWSYDAAGKETAYSYEIGVRENATGEEKVVLVEERAYLANGSPSYALTSGNCYYGNDYRTGYSYYSSGAKNGLLMKRSLFHCTTSGASYTRGCDAGSAPYDYTDYDYQLDGSNRVTRRIEQTMQQIEDDATGLPQVGDTIYCSDSSYYYAYTAMWVDFEYNVAVDATSGTTREESSLLNKTLELGAPDASSNCLVTGYVETPISQSEQWYKKDASGNYIFRRQSGVDYWWWYDANANILRSATRYVGDSDYSQYYVYEYDSYNRPTKFTRYFTAGLGSASFPDEEDIVEEYGYVDIPGANLTHGSQYKTKELRYTYNGSQHVLMSETRRALWMNDPTDFLDNLSYSLEVKEIYYRCDYAGACGYYASQNTDYVLREAVFADGTWSETTKVRFEGSGGSPVEILRTDYKAYRLSTVYPFYLTFRTKTHMSYDGAQVVYKKDQTSGRYDDEVVYDIFTEEFQYDFDSYVGHLDNLRETGYSLTGVYTNTGGSTVTDHLGQRVYNANFWELTQVKYADFCYSSGGLTCYDGPGYEFMDYEAAYDASGRMTSATLRDAEGAVIEYTTATWVAAADLPWKACATSVKQYLKGQEEANMVYEFTAADTCFPTKMWNKNTSEWMEYAYDDSTEYDPIFGNYYWFMTFKPYTTQELADQFYSDPLAMIAAQRQFMILPVTTETYKKMDGTDYAAHTFTYTRDAADRPIKVVEKSHIDELLGQTEFEWGAGE